MTHIGPIEAVKGEAYWKAHYAAVRKRIDKPPHNFKVPPIQRRAVEVSRPKRPPIYFEGNVKARTGELRIPYTLGRKVRLIMRAVSFKHGVSITDMKSHRRPHNVVSARFELFARLYRKTEMSLPQIGRTIGGRDHTSVMHGIRKFTEFRDNYQPRSVA